MTLAPRIDSPDSSTPSRCLPVGALDGRGPRWRRIALLLLLGLPGCLSIESLQSNETEWRTLEPGLELGALRAPAPPDVGDGLIQVLRIDLQRFELRLLNASAPDQGASLTAREWCERNDLVAAINASMFQEDLHTSVSLMRTRTHTNNRRLSRDRTILAFDPLDDDTPAARIIDLGCDDLDDWKDRYGTLVQSIRMVSCKGENVWSPQPRQWSTAAIGMDAKGRVLFIHVRSPFATHDLIENLRALPLEIVRLMYAEGGPKSQLYVRGPLQDHEFVGSFETSFNENDDNARAWRVPNVVAIARRSATDASPVDTSRFSNP